MASKAGKTIALMNAIWENASEDYKTYVPLATRDNISAVGNPIQEYTIVKNEFINTIVNKIAMTIVRSRLLNNPLAPLKKGSMPLGYDVEEMHVNRALAETFDPSGSTLLARKDADVAVEYHRLNRRDVYTVTISKDQLRHAFTSWEALQSLIDGIVSSMYAGDSDDEFILMKELMRAAVSEEHVVVQGVPTPTTEGAGLALIKAFKNVSSYMQFASSSFNKYHVINGGDPLADPPVPGATPRRLKTDKEDQVLIIRADIANTIDVDVLASAFNLDKVAFLSQRVEVDNFGEIGTGDAEIVAMIVDKDFFQVYDQLRDTEEFYNAKGLYWNYFYHVWQVMSYSLLVNAVAFVVDPTLDPEEPVTP